jgi:alpha-beta hydrolase superfamily lysophospholipase
MTLSAQATTGAQGFKSLLAPFAFAKRPLIDRVHALAPHLPILFVYGGKSWLSSQSGYDVQKLRQDHWHPGPTRVVVIQEAGHNVFVDAPAALSEAVLAFPQMLAQAAFHSPQFQPSLACTGMVPPLLSESQMFAGPSSFPVMLLAQNVAAQ